MAIVAWLVTGTASFFIGLQAMSFAMGALLRPTMRRSFVGVSSARLWKIFLLAIVFTGLVQSSSAVTVIGVILVRGGVLSLADDVALTLGANVGTTVTGQLVSLSLRQAIPVCLVLGLVTMVISLSSRGSRKRWICYSGLAVSGLGVLLTGFELLQFGLGLASRESFLWARSLAWAGGGAWPSFFSGLVSTGLVQSSSLVLGSTISLASQGLMPFSAALFVMLGSNVGTALTTLLAGIGGSRTARAASLGNLVFNLLSVLLILPFVGVLSQVAQGTSADPGRQLANAHTIFNAVTAVTVLPFAPLLAGFLIKIASLFASRED